MSVDLMTRVWKTAPVGGSELLVLLALADFGNDDGSGIYPSVKTIAHKARLSEDQTRRLIHKLIALGLVELVEVGGWDGKRNRSNEYKITMQGACPNASTVPAQMQVPSPRRHKGGTRADASTGTSTDAATVPAPVRDDPSLEPPLETPLEPSIESSSSDDDEKAQPWATVVEAWYKNYADPMPAKLYAPLQGLIAECGVEAVVHGISAAAQARARTFSYIAQCARNYIPPAPQAVPSYQVDLPGVFRMEPPPQPALRPLPVAQTHSATLPPWELALEELRRGFGAYPWLGDLQGSYLEARGDVADPDGRPKPLYRVVVTATTNTSWLTTQAGTAIRRTLGSILGKPVLVEIAAVAAEMEPAV